MVIKVGLMSIGLNVVLVLNLYLFGSLSVEF